MSWLRDFSGMVFIYKLHTVYYMKVLQLRDLISSLSLFDIIISILRSVHICEYVIW